MSDARNISAHTHTVKTQTTCMSNIGSQMHNIFFFTPITHALATSCRDWSECRGIWYLFVYRSGYPQLLKMFADKHGWTLDNINDSEAKAILGSRLHRELCKLLTGSVTVQVPKGTKPSYTDLTPVELESLLFYDGDRDEDDPLTQPRELASSEQELEDDGDDDNMQLQPRAMRTILKLMKDQKVKFQRLPPASHCDMCTQLNALCSEYYDLKRLEAENEEEGGEEEARPAHYQQWGPYGTKAQAQKRLKQLWPLLRKRADHKFAQMGQRKFLHQVKKGMN